MNRHEIPIGPRPNKVRIVLRAVVIAAGTFAIVAVFIAALAIRS